MRRGLKNRSHLTLAKIKPTCLKISTANSRLRKNIVKLDSLLPCWREMRKNIYRNKYMGCNIYIKIYVILNSYECRLPKLLGGLNVIIRRRSSPSCYLSHQDIEGNNRFWVITVSFPRLSTLLFIKLCKWV